MLVLGGCYPLELGEHVLQEKQRAVVDARQASTEPAREAELVSFLHDLVLLLLPVHAEGRVGKEVVEGLPREAVVLMKLSPKRMLSLAPLWSTCFISMSEAAVAKARLL